MTFCFYHGKVILLHIFYCKNIKFQEAVAKMKQAINKWIGIALAVCMLVASAPIAGFVGFDSPAFSLGADFNHTANAAEVVDSGSCGENLTYVLDSDGVLTISGTGDMEDYYYSPPLWYESSESIKEVIVENGVTSIGNSAFAGCESLANITVDANNAIYSSDENGVLFNKDKTTLIQYPIGNTRTSYTIPDSVTSIGAYAFAFCTSLASITFGENSQLTSIGYSAFSSCDSLASITIPDSVTSIGNYAFSYCDSLESVTFGENSQLTSIGDYAFYLCDSLASITLPNSVTNIGNQAFYACTNLASITIPNSVTSIGDRAFESCYNLASVAFGENSQLTSIVMYAFSGCTSLASITLPDSVTSIGNQAFYRCTGLASITLPDSVTSIGEDAFYGCTNLASITLPDSVTSIGSSTFYNTAYYNDESNWLDGVLYIDNCLIAAKTDISGAYVINNGTKVIAGDAFYCCENLVSVTIPDSVTSIGESAFYLCTSLASITIPDSVTSIGSGAFSNTAYYNDESNWLKGVLYIDKCLIGAKTDISGAYVINNDTRVIASGAFFGCASLESVTISDSVTNIGDYAFAYCGSLESVTMPDSVTEITYGAFRSCTSLTEITLPDSVTSISDQSFNGCSSLASITIPNRVTTIGGYAFYTCLALSDVYYIGSEKEWNAIDIGPKNDSLLNATIHFVDMTPSFSDSEIVFVNEDGNLVSRVGTTAEDLLALAGEDASLVNNKGETLAETDKIGTGAVLTLADGTRYEIVVLGDIDGDGAISAGDARSALRNSVSLDVLAGVYLKAAKVNGEGPVNAGDARSILRASVGLDNPDEWYEKAAG